LFEEPLSIFFDCTAANGQNPSSEDCAVVRGWSKYAECNENTNMKLTAAYKQVGDWWAAWVEEIPGVNTQGKTLEEARENLKDALQMVLEANRELAEEEHKPTRREELVFV
jgi:predicted RNase H-like HicB family nuclease